jgi:peptidoglycan hydrolase-like protein with peptidoglycan-binding domain
MGALGRKKRKQTLNASEKRTLALAFTVLAVGAGAAYAARKRLARLALRAHFPDTFPLRFHGPALPTPAPFVHAATKAVSRMLTGNFVKDMQSALTGAGYSTGGVDGVWGRNTSSAALGYQSAKGLTRTGLPEADLVHALGVTPPPLPLYIGSNIASALQSGFGGIAQNVLDMVKLFLHESDGMQPSIQNPQGFVGIFQLSQKYIQPLTGLTVDAFKALTAAGQVPFAAKFLLQNARAFHAPLPLSGRDLYWLNYLPATYKPGADDGYPFVWSNDTYAKPSGERVSFPGVYTQNRNLDHGGKGFITAGDMALALNDGAKAHPAIYASLASALSSPLGVA